MSMNEYSLRKAFFGKHYIKQDVDNQLSSMRSEIENLEKKVKAAQEEKDFLNDRISQGETVRLDQETLINEKEERIEELETVNEDLKQKAKAAQEKLEKTLHEKSTLETQVKDLKASDEANAQKIKAGKKEFEDRLAAQEKKKTV